jgi:hypothetical protein
MMRHHRQVGFMLYSANYDYAVKKLHALFSDGHECLDPEFRLLPETALGTPLSFPNAPSILCLRLFMETAVMAVRVAEMTDEEMRKSRTEAIWERFWMGDTEE